MTSSRKDTPSKANAGSHANSKAGRFSAPTKTASRKKRTGVIAGKAPKRTAEGALPTRASSAPRVREEQRANKSGQWILQDAKARFSELVRRVKVDGPQRVSVRGRVEVVVISADEFRRLKGELTGAALIEAMQASPHREVDIAPARSAMPVRNIEL